MTYQYTNSKGVKYYLHRKTVRLRDSGKTENLYYFRRKIGDEAVEEFPEGYKTKELKGFFISTNQGVLAEVGLPILERS